MNVTYNNGEKFLFPFPYYDEDWTIWVNIPVIEIQELNEFVEINKPNTIGEEKNTGVHGLKC